jgi:L-lysine exporter family protein LysE/ArgO
VIAPDLGISHFLLGLLLGLALIVPIGVQSLFVLNQGLLVGFPRAFIGVSTVCLCDSFLIVLGAAGASAFLAALGYQEVLTAAGSVFLFVLGLLALRARSRYLEARSLAPIGATVAQAVGVSMLNPHAILDTVGVLGAAIAAQAAHERVAFAAGAVGASWAWYLILSMGASALQTRLTPRARLCIQRSSGLVMLAFACILALKLV